MAYSSISDVVIVGGGLAGTLAATLLGRAGFQVVLIDGHELYPPQFRAEQLVGEQVSTLAGLELADVLIGDATPMDKAIGIRAGKPMGFVHAPHYGIHYDTMVNRARKNLPPSVRFVVAQVADLALSADRQHVALADGSIIPARLVVMATGFGQRLMRDLGIGKRAVRENHSMAFGFDVEVEDPSMFQSAVLVAYGENPLGAIDYLTIFAIGDTLRANLFTYADRRDPWTKQFVREPLSMLRQAMPTLERITSKILSVGPVQLRVNDLKVATDYRRDGLVLVGDAFQTSCPAAGTGIGRLVNDIDRLCTVHIPKWLATEGMDAAKLGAFYEDPIKVKCDAEALRQATYRRALTTETGIAWKIHRHRVALQAKISMVTKRTMRAGIGMANPFGSARGMAPTPMPAAVRNKRGTPPQTNPVPPS